MKAWPHQDYAIGEVRRQIREGQKRILLSVPTRGGKTFIAAALIRSWVAEGFRVGLYTNRRLLVEQLSKMLDEYGITHGIRAAGKKREHELDVQICSIQTEQAGKKKAEKFEGQHVLHQCQRVVIDECFIGETPILTPRGWKRIDNVRCGDSVYCALGVGTVRGVSCRPTTYLMTLEFSNGVFIACTESHKFFTARGWIEARSLGIGEITYGPEAVRLLWQNLEAVEETSRNSFSRYERGFMESPEVLRAILCEEIGQSYEQESGTLKNASDYPPIAISTDQAWREWAIASLSSACDVACAGEWLGSRVRSSNQEAERKQRRLPDLLQGGHCQSKQNDCHRSGWDLSQFPGSEATGRKEDGLLGIARLVGSSRCEHASPVPVFNLHVSRHPSYFANGRLVHNCHINTGPGIVEVKAHHESEGAVILGLTATPIDLGAIYDVLVQAGLNSQLRNCGALVPALHFGPDEPDLKAFKKLKKSLAMIESETAEITEGQSRDMMMTPTIFGRVWEWFERLNPDIDGRRPTILFAPGVRESLWFCEQFEARGVRAAHIDGKHIWIGGELHRTTQALRQEVLDGSESGRITVLCNRFVLREGIDAPWLAHGIFATVFGSLQTYLQSGGRLLGANPGLESVTIQDHGGNWWRYGSLNADRIWNIDDTTSILQGMRADACREKKLAEPFRCPMCGLICIAGKCGGCGWVPTSTIKSRPVIGTNGELRMMVGDIYRPRKIYQKSNGPAVWERLFWRSRTEKGARSFRAAAALFAQENNWMWPDNRWPLMPRDPKDSFRLVGDVPFDRLIPKETTNGEDERSSST